MKYCSKCGKEIVDDAVVCIHCGRQVEGADTGNQNSKDAPSPGFAVLSGFFPIVGLILYLVYHESHPQKARSAGKGALIGVACWVAYMLLVYGTMLS